MVRLLGSGAGMSPTMMAAASVTETVSAAAISYRSGWPWASHAGQIRTA
jgi:hypothetical protein